MRGERVLAHRLCRRLCGAATLSILALALCAPSAPRAAGPPQLGEAWATEVSASSARLHAEIDPNGLFSSYRFDYIPAAAYEANLKEGEEGFAGAQRAPAGADAPLGSGTSAVAVSVQLSQLLPETAYRYRVRAENGAGAVTSTALDFATQGLGGAGLLLDGRGWEMVSPVEKNGGEPERAAPLQAAAGGESVIYGSSASFGEGAQGAPDPSQYLARRGAGSWSAENISPPLLSGSYARSPYRAFSVDLARGLLSNGDRCRGGGGGCAVANPPLAGTDAPAGYRNYYLRDGGSGAYEALLGGADLSFTPLSAAQLDLDLAGASPDLRHLVLSSCAALTADATEVPAPEGCDPAAQNLYEWSEGRLELLNLRPGESQGTPGAALAAPLGAVSAGGERVYWSQGGELFLREGDATKQLDAALGGGAVLQTASADGSLAYFTVAGHLYRYDAVSEAIADLTPAGEVAGVLGASADGSRLYYLTAAGLFLREGGASSEIAAVADASDYPPAAGTARISADGARLAFLSKAPLTGYDNTEQRSGAPVSEVYLYDALAGSLTCASCNPTGARPLGPSTIPGARGETPPYKPRALSEDGGRLFFDSEDALVLADTDAAPDVYEWESRGTGSCERAGGCLALISSGRASGGATLADASADGSDVFFFTEGSLIGSDPGALDLYDARIGGGFPAAPAPIPCEGDACQSLPPAPPELALNTLVAGPGNPPVRYRKLEHHRHRHRPHHRHHRHKGLAR